MVCLYIIYGMYGEQNCMYTYKIIYVYIQNGMYGRVVRLPCTYVQFLWTTRKFSEQVVYGTNTYGQLFWTTRPFLKYRGTYGTEEVAVNEIRRQQRALDTSSSSTPFKL